MVESAPVMRSLTLIYSEKRWAEGWRPTAMSSSVSATTVWAVNVYGGVATATKSIKAWASPFAFSTVFYSMHSIARTVSRACVPVVRGWFSGGRMRGSHVDHRMTASYRVRPGMRRAITASWKRPSTKRARGADMWSKRSWSGSGSSGDAMKAARASSLVGEAATVGA